MKRTMFKNIYLIKVYSIIHSELFGKNSLKESKMLVQTNIR